MYFIYFFRDFELFDLFVLENPTTRANASLFSFNPCPSDVTLSTFPFNMCLTPLILFQDFCFYLIVDFSAVFLVVGLSNASFLYFLIYDWKC